ncbi:hypothetical protein ERHA55_19670 [Erwinia rhapontici]|nr:hypothetical protein ERHA55_19670 [Erwinia rhapontici]
MAQTVVAARELGSVASVGADARQLVAWLIAQPGVTLDTAVVHQQVAQRLPAHMLPVSYVLTDHFPLSANGKLDRKSLPLPQTPQSEGRPPEGLHEQLLVTLFSSLLARDTVYADDDFFALGGTRCWRCAWPPSCAVACHNRSLSGRSWPHVAWKTWHACWMTARVA